MATPCWRARSWPSGRRCGCQVDIGPHATVLEGESDVNRKGPVIRLDQVHERIMGLLSPFPSSRQRFAATRRGSKRDILEQFEVRKEVVTCAMAQPHSGI
ncbi:hypothetical protein EJB05_27715 [Eragrostis curvula]|uniref:Uncharacterized protein n=1 Tax=Eragrostis curvula TaxID=38414 RepID=A0A5J9UNT1_9POAL|nr:hypothetical protein EJB05_27715 [Eragrostis curvula]